MTRRASGAAQSAATRPFERQQLSEEGEVAQRVARVMEAIREFDQDKVTATIWRKEGSATGSWQWCDDCSLPPDIPAIMADMRERFGAGAYEIRVTALGRIRGNILFAIAKEKTPAVAPVPVTAPAAAPMSMQDMLGLFMSQQAEARREAADARREAQAAADRQQTMVIGMVTAIAPTLIPLFTGASKGTTAADTIALVTALQGAKGGGSDLKEMVETLALLKNLTDTGGGGGGGEGGGGFDIGEILSDGGRLVGPAVKALADLVSRNRDAGAPGGHSASAAAPPGGGGQLALGPPGAPASRYPLLDLVRTDVVYFFGRGFDPEKAADLVYDVIEANIEAKVITGDEVNAVAAAFAFSPTGLDDLAAEGIDLRSRPDWAAEFFQHLATIHNEAPQDFGGSEGGAANTGNHGAPGQAGEA